MNNLLLFFTKYYHWLVFLILEAASGVLLFKNNHYQGSHWISTSNAVVGMVYGWQADVEHFFSMAASNEQLTAKNLYLEQEVRRLREKLDDQKTDTSAQARQAMELLGQFSCIPAKVVANSVQKPDNLMTIDKGTADGVTPDMGVACGTGLVGVVYQASEHYAIVIPLLNRRSHISCAIRGHSYFGYVGWDGGDPLKAYMEDVPRHAKIKKGEWVETSGFSTIFPAGISVGKIIGIQNSADGMSYRLVLHLSTDFASLRDVCVISDKGMVEQMRLQQAAADSLEISNENNE